MGGSQRKQRDPVTDDIGPSESAGAGKPARRGKAGSGGSNKAGQQRQETPRWRQIEIMRERQALRDMLDDFGDHDIDFDDDIFGFGAEQDVYFRAAEGAMEEVGDEPEDGDFPDDDFEDD